jgi:hypothetical protein
VSGRERDKGARGELEVVQLVRTHWPRATRNFASGAAGNLDIAHGPTRVVIDVKRTERLRFREAWREAAKGAAKAGDGVMPMVATRWNRTRSDSAPWLAIVELEPLLAMLARLEDAR